MKKTIRHCLYVSLLMLLPLWTACDKDIHENDRHGLAVGMEWLEGIEPTDITSPVNLWIYDAEGHEVEAHEFSSPQELASGLFSLPEGDYTLVGVCGLTEPFRYDYENGTRTAALIPLPRFLPDRYGWAAGLPDWTGQNTAERHPLSGTPPGGPAGRGGPPPR